MFTLSETKRNVEVIVFMDSKVCIHKKGPKIHKLLNGRNASWIREKDTIKKQLERSETGTLVLSS